MGGVGPPQWRNRRCDFRVRGDESRARRQDVGPGAVGLEHERVRPPRLDVFY
jgi:hypothetical protein